MKKLSLIILANLISLNLIVGQSTSLLNNRDWTILEAYTIPGKASGLAWDGQYLYTGTVFSGDDNVIYRIDPADGSFVTQCIAPIDGAYGLTYDESSGNLWTTNHPGAYDPALAMQIDMSGNLVSQFELPATYFSGIAWDNGDFWATCYYDPDGEVFKVNGTGTVLDQFPTSGNQPWDICTQDEFLWIVDYDLYMIYKVDQTGVIQESYASEGVKPSGIVYDGNFLWYCDGATGVNSTLYKIDLGGAGNPEIVVPVTDYDYGIVTIETTAIWECYIENTGNVALGVTYGNISGAGSEYINWPQGNSFTIEAGENETIIIEYSPIEAGSLNVIATLETNDPINPEVDLLMTGVAVYDGPYLVLIEDNHDYSDVRINATTRWFLQIQNYGDETLSINEVTLDHPQFYVDTGTQLPLNVQPLSTVEIGFWFSPDDNVDFEAVAEIVSNDAYQNQNEVELSGSGLLKDWIIGDVFWNYQLPYDYDISIKALSGIMDVTGDNVGDVIVCSEDDYIRCFNGNSHGNADLIWEHFVYSGSVYSQNGIAVNDITGDGQDEVIIGTAWGDRSIIALNGNTGEVLWKYQTNVYGSGGWVYQVDTKFDFNNDGIIDVLAATGDDSYDTGPKRVFCLNGLNGDVIWNSYLGGPVFSVIGVSDFTNDNHPDVIAGASNSDESQGFIYGIDGVNGTILWNKQTIGTSVWALSDIDDINESGVKDIIAGDFSGNFYIIDPGTEDILEQGSIGSSLILRFVKMDDVNNDGFSDVLVAHSGYNAIILDGTNGNAIVNEPLADKCWNVARIDDVSGDAVNDFVAGTLFSSNYAYIMDGVSGVNLFSQNYGEAIDGINTIADINNDGSMEMVVGGRYGKLVCYSGGLNAVVGQKEIFNSQGQLMHSSYPNPFCNEVVISFELTQNEHVRIVIYDFLGREVECLVDKQFEKGINKVKWNTDGTQTESTFIFYYTISVSGKKYTGKLINIP